MWTPFFVFIPYLNQFDFSKNTSGFLTTNYSQLFLTYTEIPILLSKLFPIRLFCFKNLKTATHVGNLHALSTTPSLQGSSTEINRCGSWPCFPFRRDIQAVIYYLFLLKLLNCHLSVPLPLEKNTHRIKAED